MAISNSGSVIINHDNDDARTLPTNRTHKKLKQPLPALNFPSLYKICICLTLAENLHRHFSFFLAVIYFLFLREVPELNWNSVIGSKGYLAISNTRCGTEDLWLEWYKQVLLYFPRLKLRMINIKQKV